MACGGEGKSGSPDARLITLMPCAANSRALIVMITEAEMETRFNLSARAGIEKHSYLKKGIDYGATAA
jgi:hypothetical protein